VRCDEVPRSARLHVEPRIGDATENTRNHPSTDEQRRSDLGGIARAAGSAILLGTMAVTAKFAYDAGTEAIPLLAGRFVVCTLLLWLYHLVTGKRLLVGRSKVIKLAVLGAIGYSAVSIFLFAALERAPAGVVGLVFYSYPMWTAVIAFAARIEPFKLRTVAALVIGSIGVVLVFSLPQGGTTGPLLALGAAVSIAIYLILMQMVLEEGDATAATFWMNLGAGSVLVPIALFSGGEIPSGGIVPAILLGVTSAVAFVILYVAIPRIGSARASVASMIEPVTTITLAAILLDEDVTLRVVVGAALVVSALPLLALRERRTEDPVVAVP
jgi:drug/metabolite transporter (DMT)-like permease